MCGVLCVLYVWCGDGGGGGPEADILPTSESRSAPSQWWTGHPPAGGPGPRAPHNVITTKLQVH